MSNNQFSHVCTSCRAPALVTPRKQSTLHFVILGIATLLGALFADAFFVDQGNFLARVLIGGSIGFAAAFTYFYLSIRRSQA